jgi:catechol 2,3-dioxygenase-like lactoylglutathione lyase family enzyme
MDTIAKSRIKKMSPQLLVSDLDSSMAFYTEKLGFDVDFRHEDFYSGVIKEGYSIHLKLGSPLRDERQNKRDNEDLDIVFSVQGIEDLYEEYSARSVEFTQPLRDMAYGKEFYVVDPDGYLLGFLEEV